MSQLFVVVRPSVAAGFRLAGVETFEADNPALAQTIITRLLQTETAGLLAIDEGLLAEFPPAFHQELDEADFLPYIALPGGEPYQPGMSAQSRIAELIRQAIGFQITFGDVNE